MNNKYQEYNPEDFDYDYPYTWEKRNKEYLELRDDRPVVINYITTENLNEDKE